MCWKRIALLGLAVAALAGCASRPINERLAQVDLRTGYRPYLLVPKLDNDQHTLFVLSFSGGGTRAAALSYGVLEELRRTEIKVEGRPRRLIDEVDLMTGVSGGSFTALSYALYGERLFAEYEQRFLKRDVQGTLLGRLANPMYWSRFLGGSAGRSELAADYYDEILFGGATFGELLDKRTPAAVATGTDLSTGSRLAFFQNDFDLICSDLSKFRLSRAAATSSAVPVVLSPVTLNNYGGTCGNKPPSWMQAVAEGQKAGRVSGRAMKRYAEMEDFQNSKERPYIHLVDGGVSDNIGARGVLETLEELGASAEYRGEIGFGIIRNIVIILVNSHSAPSTDWDKKETPPGLFLQLMQASGVPIDRYSFETVESMKDRAEIVNWKRELEVAKAQLAGESKEQAEARVPKVTLRVIDVAFDAIRDPKERTYFMDLPTSFSLPAEAVDRLREVAGRLLRQSPEYAGLLNQYEVRPSP